MQPTDKNKKAPAGEQGAILRDHFYKSKSIKKRTGNQDYLLSQALELAENGIPNFPCRKNKAPAICGWNERYSTDPRELKLNYTFYSSPKLIGVPTGAVSGFDVLDIDPRNDGNKWLYEKIDYLPYTRIHHTPSYGRNWWARRCESYNPLPKPVLTSPRYAVTGF